MMRCSSVSVISSEIKGKNSCQILRADKSNSNLSSSQIIQIQVEKAHLEGNFQQGSVST